jgi:hypothetical protein
MTDEEFLNNYNDLNKLINISKMYEAYIQTKKDEYALLIRENDSVKKMTLFREISEMTTFLEDTNKLIDKEKQKFNSGTSITYINYGY